MFYWVFCCLCVSGSGKTFTLLTLAYAFTHRPIYTIIFKNDLLVPFEYISKVYSVAQFFMEILNLPYFVYVNFVEQLSAKLSPSDYIKIIAQLLSMMRMIDMRDVLVIIDEYTVINKSLMFVLLIIFKHYKVGCVISGDKNQLQTIKDSKNTKSITSFDIVQLFADKTFNFTKNERCSSSYYNEKIQLVAQYSTDTRLDDFGYCLVAATLFDNIYGIQDYTDTFLASVHRNLAITQHFMVSIKENEIHTSFYTVDNQNPGAAVEYPKNVLAYIEWATRLHRGENDNMSVTSRNTTYPFKFLPYLPLKLHAMYYVYEYSDSCVGELIDMDFVNQIMTMKMVNTGVIERVRPSSKHDRVIFDEHLRWLKERQSEDDARTLKILNYPIYPARFMTIHRCQGCTITDRINIDLNDSNYQALYVAMSRVKNQDQIVSIKIPRQLSYVLTTIVNFSEYCDATTIANTLTPEVIKSRLSSNYHMYTPKNMWYDYYLQLALGFIQNPGNRKKIRDEILSTLQSRTVSSIIKVQVANAATAATITNTTNITSADSTTKKELNTEDDESVITHIMNNLEYYKLLTWWSERDRLYWIHEFLRIHPDFKADRLMSAENNRLLYTTIDSLRMIHTHTNLVSIPLSQSSLDNIMRHCRVSSKKTDLTVCKGILGYSQAASLFQKKLYEKLSSNETDADNRVTEAWLIEMLETIRQHDQVSSPDIDKPVEAVGSSKKNGFRSSLSNVVFDVPAVKRKRLTVANKNSTSSSSS